MTNNKKRQHLINIITKYLETNNALMGYYHDTAEDRKAKLVCNKSIKRTKEAIKFLSTINHIEVLEYLYSAFIGNNIIAYSISGSMILSKQLAYYDSEEGFEEFLKEQEEKKQKQLAKEKDKQEQMEAVKKARVEGKNVEMVWDKETKKVRPLIVEDKPKA